MRAGDLVELSTRLPNHGGRVVRLTRVGREWDEDTERFDTWAHYVDPDGKVGEDGNLLSWRVLAHFCILARHQRPDYAEQDRQARERDRLRQRADAALKMSLQRLGLVRVPKSRRADAER
ncbi:MAG: hypothetical protein VW239_07340 [Candidatus Nanopelagicales bacterium]